MLSYFAEIVCSTGLSSTPEMQVRRRASSKFWTMVNGSSGSAGDLIPAGPSCDLPRGWLHVRKSKIIRTQSAQGRYYDDVGTMVDWYRIGHHGHRLSTIVGIPVCDGLSEVLYCGATLSGVCSKSGTCSDAIPDSVC